MSLPPIENMETSFFNIYRRSVGPVHGQKHSVAIDLTTSWKSKINNIKAIENEATNIQNQNYPVDVSDTTAKVLPKMPRTPDFVEVLLAQPIAQGAGGSSNIDLKDTIRKKMLTVILNESITATQIQPAIINSATKTVNLLPIENMEATLLNIYRERVILFMVKHTHWL